MLRPDRYSNYSQFAHPSHFLYSVQITSNHHKPDLILIQSNYQEGGDQADGDHHYESLNWDIPPARCVHTILCSDHIFKVVGFGL